jgi:hypothetical protein
VNTPKSEHTERDEHIKRRSAQAMAATYVQMVRHAELAYALHLARAKATRRRLERSTDPEEIARLTRQLGAQHQQGASIESAVDRFRRRMGNLSAFREAGLTDEDFQNLGLQDLLKTHKPEQPVEKPEPEPEPDFSALARTMGTPSSAADSAAAAEALPSAHTGGETPSE